MMSCDCENGLRYKTMINWDKANFCPFCGVKLKKPCPNCSGDKTVLTEKDGLGLRYIIDCPTCEKEV